MTVFRHGHGSDDPRAGKVEVTGRIVVDKPLAILLDDGTGQAWLPKSRIRIEPTKDAGIVEVLMPEWLAKEKGYV